MLATGRWVVEWVARRTNDFGNFGTEAGIGWLKDGNLIAGVAYAEWNGPNVVCHIASDGTRKWLSRAYLWAIFDYPFRVLECNRITVCVGEGNKDSRRFVEHLGFKLEATLQDAHPSGNLLVYKMSKGECRFLREKYAKRAIHSIREAQGNAA